MTEHIYLNGAEDVRAAGHRIAKAAETIRGAAGEIEMALQREAQRRDQFLDRLEEILKTDCAARAEQVIQFVIDGETVTEAVVRRMPEVLAKKGITEV